MNGRSGRNVVVAIASAGVVVGIFLLAWLDNVHYIKFAGVLRWLLAIASMVLVSSLQLKRTWALGGVIVSVAVIAGILVERFARGGPLTQIEVMLSLVMGGAALAFLATYRGLRWPNVPLD